VGGNPRQAPAKATGTRSAAEGLVKPGPEGKLLDYEAAAHYLCTTPRHVRKLWQTRRLAAVKVGRCVRFAIADLDGFIAANRVPASRPARPRRRGAASSV